MATFKRGGDLALAGPIASMRCFVHCVTE